MNKKCQLAVVAEGLGASAFDLSPKCHAEILAGEGIEYMIWGFFKRRYRRELVELEKNIESEKGRFLSLVTDVMGDIDAHNCRLIAQRQRRYMLEKGEDYNSIMKNTCSDTINYVNIEKLVREFKTHRSALDFSHAFITQALNDYESRKLKAKKKSNNEQIKTITESVQGKEKCFN